jgi:hypothetical protein
MVNWIEKLTEPAPEQRFKSATDAFSALKSGMALNATGDREDIPANHLSKQPAPFANNSGYGNILDSSIAVPEEIKGWNWGAFLLSAFWPFTNRVWIGLLCWAPQAGWMMAFVLGAKGNEWAWKSRRWRSIEQFKAHQRGWAIAGILFGIPVSLMLWLAMFVLFMDGF